MEIMLVEDSLLDARITIESLRKCGIHHRVTLFRDGSEAVEFLQQRGIFTRAPRPDVILLDLILPHTDGFELLKLLRASQNIESIPVVVLTSSDDGADKQACEALGVTTYIRKPFNEVKFLSVIRRFKELSLVADFEESAVHAENPTAHAENPSVQPECPTA
ncbi:MAG: response regulator [Pirellulaceae bacterium]|nr:response regulator [Pirellulaceae bacterium]